MFNFTFRKSVLLSALLFVFLSGMSNAAPVGTARGKITLFATGWNVNSFRVATSAPFTDIGCGAIDGYIASPADPANAAHRDALLMAWQNNKFVSFVVDGCYASRPKIIGVYVTN